jgi:hypothetical protein
MKPPRIKLRSLVILVAFLALVSAVVVLSVDNARLRRDALAQAQRADAAARMARMAVDQYLTAITDQLSQARLDRVQASAGPDTSKTRPPEGGTPTKDHPP